MVARLVHPNFEHAAHLHLLLQQRVVVLLEQLREKLVGMAPLGLVIVFDDEGLAGFWCGLGRPRGEPEQGSLGIVPIIESPARAQFSSRGQRPISVNLRVRWGAEEYNPARILCAALECGSWLPL